MGRYLILYRHQSAWNDAFNERVQKIQDSDKWRDARGNPLKSSEKREIKYAKEAQKINDSTNHSQKTHRWKKQRVHRGAFAPTRDN